MRGVGFLHSPLLNTSGYVSDQMLHVTDWLPTLLSAAGGSPESLNNLDGVDAWSMLSNNGSPVRTEMLHNIDPYGDFAGIRVGDYKLLIGNVGVGWDGWYPPYQLQGDETKLHYLNFTDNFSESTDVKLQREKLNENYQKYWGTEILERIKELETERKQKEKLVFQSEKTDASGKTLVYEKGTPVRVECGEKPANASTNCDPRKYPCLFHIPSDPCEYTNLANQHTDVVSLPKSFSNLFHLFS